MRPTLVAMSLVVALGGCKKEGGGETAPGGAPIAAASTDALWAFAPPHVSTAFVVADGAIAPLHAAAVRVLADLDKAPGGAKLTPMLREQLSQMPINPLDPAALTGIGIDLSKGAALFEGPEGKVAVLPVVDSKKLLAKVGGTTEGGFDHIGPMMCKDVGGRYLCAGNQALFDAAAKGGGQSQVAMWPTQMRGHIEVYVSGEEMGARIPLENPQGMRVGVILERGAATVRVHVVGKPAGPMVAALGGKSSLTAGLADKQPVGLLTVSAAGLWAQVKESAAHDAGGAPPLPGGVTAVELVNAIKGELVGYALPGPPPRGMAKIALVDEAPVKKLLGACGELGKGMPPGITITSKADHCAVSFDPSVLGPQMPAIGPMKIEAWVEGGALVIGLGDHAAASSVKPGLAPFAKEILEGEWLFAGWGQGSLAGGPLLNDKAQLDAMRAQDPTGGVAMWALNHLNEFGVAVRVADDGIHGVMRVRTLWANPDEVVTAVQAKVGEFAAGNYDALASLSEVAAKYPDSPFAHDYKSGAAGLMAPVGAIGVLAAVSIPAFMKYTRKSKSVEPRVMVRKMYDGAREHWMDPGVVPGSIEPAAPSFPTPSAGPTPPLGTCCAQGGKCMPDPALWEAEPWRSLHFSVDDPSYYSYEYKVNPGKPGALDGSHNFTVSAYGNLDCDGEYSTFSMTGVIDQTYMDGPSGAVELMTTDEME